MDSLKDFFDGFVVNGERTLMALSADMIDISDKAHEIAVRCEKILGEYK